MSLTAGLAASGLLAAGVVATLRWRRRAALRSRPTDLRLPTPAPEAFEEVTRMEAAAVPEGTLDDLAALLASIPPDAHPALVTATDDGAVTLLFDDDVAVPGPPPPWKVADDDADGPVGWRASLGDRGPERSVGLPLLATLGRTGDTTVLANVAAMRVLLLVGPQREMRRRLRAISLEVATSRIAVPVEVAVAEDQLLGSLDRVRHVDDLAAEVAAATAEHAADVVVEDRTPRLLVAHDVAAAPAMPDDLAGHVGLVVAAPDATDGWLLELDRDDAGRLQLPDGGQSSWSCPRSIRSCSTRSSPGWTRGPSARIRRNQSQRPRLRFPPTASRL